jgi:DNA polymerase-1
VAIEQAAEYSARLAHGLLAARAELDRRLEAAGLTSLMNDLELPLALLLADIESVGVCLDVAYLRELSDAVGADIAGLERRVYELAGEEVNLGSPKQLSHLLFHKLGLKSDKMRKTATGFSTDHEVLESMAEDHAIVGLILEHRELIKLKGTYLDALPPLVSPRTGRIHTTFNQAVTATGRLSSQEPNLQNIPVRTELGRKIRRAFVAAPGKTLVSADYSQIELRILAHLSGDPVLLHAFRTGIDVHTQTAAEVFGMPLEQVGADERRVAKAVNYGLVYGQSQFGLARALRIPRAEAKRYIERYFDRFATVRDFMEQIIRDARASGVTTTVLGRRRPLADLRSKNFQRRQGAERMAKNTPMQGSAADIIKLAMLKVARRMQKEPYDATMLLTVHDELVFEVRPDQAEAFAAVVVEEMAGAYELKVPLEVTVGIADNWAEAH